jgi:tetratricopeptide (TPR) repeat protein
MSEIQKIKKEALELRKQGRYSEALKLYNDLWANHGESCNEWEGWGFATCLRKLGNSEEALEICRTIYQNKPDFEAGKKLYAWCVYDTEIKKDNEQIKKDENKFFKAANAILTLTQQDQYSPYTKTIFRVIDYLIKTKASYPADDIMGWVDKLDPNSLSREPFSFKGHDGKHREIQSDQEKWFAIKTKALEKIGSFQECIELSERALINTEKFHHNNDIWFKRRIALSKANLGDKNQAVEELKNILQNKKEWFIQHEIAQICYDLGKMEEALVFAIEAALNFGISENKWELFLLMARILKSQDRLDDAKKHLMFAAKLRMEQEWSMPEPLNMMLNELNLDISESINKKELFKSLKIFWETEKYSNLLNMQGIVKAILKNGKVGFITGDDGKDYYFKINSFKGDKNRPRNGLKVSFVVEDSYDKKKNVKTKIATHVREMQ